MLPIQDSRISFDGVKWAATCACGKSTLFSTKNNAIKMLAKNVCKYCCRKYQTIKNSEIKIYLNSTGKWCSTCSGCSKEQAYTRKDHAKQSEANDWQCKACVAQAKGRSNNLPVGDRQRLFNKFQKAAANRNLEWRLTLEQMFAEFDGQCALSGWPISLSYGDPTASLDRIDSKKGYTPCNVQWVHSMVNMCKNKYDQAKFIDMCKAIANKEKW